MGGDMRKKNTEETDLKKSIREYLRLTGWYVYPNTAGIASHPGLADMTAIKKGRVVQIEAKTPKGRQSDNQKNFEADWTGQGGEYVIIRTVEDALKLNEEK
jgi:hypothetical protein